MFSTLFYVHMYLSKQGQVMACYVAMLKTDTVLNLKRKYQGQKIQNSTVLCHFV